MQDLDANTLKSPSVVNIYPTNKTKAELHLPDFDGGSIGQIAVVTIAIGVFGFQIAYAVQDMTKKYIRFMWGDWVNMDGWKKLSLV